MLYCRNGHYFGVIQNTAVGNCGKCFLEQLDAADTGSHVTYAKNAAAGVFAHQFQHSQRARRRDGRDRKNLHRNCHRRFLCSRFAVLVSAWLPVQLVAHFSAHERLHH
jgi:hypothetical protein